mgnify:CR=1 FL=1
MSRKFFASKFCDSRFGRRRILTKLGQDGETLISNLKIIFHEAEDKKIAIWVKKTLLKFILKIRVMVSKQRLTTADFKRLRPHFEHFLLACKAYLSDPSKKTVFQEQLFQLRTALGLFLASKRLLLQEKNRNKLERLLGLFALHSFVSALWNPLLTAERIFLLELTNKYIDLFPSKFAFLSALCTVRGCTAEKTDLQGSPYCAFHHSKIFSSSITLLKFLHNPVSLNFFLAFLEEQKKEHFYLLWKKALNLAQAKNSSLKFTRIQKFLSSQIVLKTALLLPRSGTPSEKINLAKHLLYSRLEREFGFFQLSPFFEEWVKNFSQARTKEGKRRGSAVLPLPDTWTI